MKETESFGCGTGYIYKRGSKCNYEPISTRDNRVIYRGNIWVIYYNIINKPVWFKTGLWKFRQ